MCLKVCFNEESANTEEEDQSLELGNDLNQPPAVRNKSKRRICAEAFFIVVGTGIVLFLILMFVIHVEGGCPGLGSCDRPG